MLDTIKKQQTIIISLKSTIKMFLFSGAAVLTAIMKSLSFVEGQISINEDAILTYLQETYGLEEQHGGLKTLYTKVVTQNKDEIFLTIK